MTTYDEWKSTEPEDPYADELELERRPIPTNRLVSTFIRPGLAEFDRRNDAYNREMEELELERRDAEMVEDEPEYDGSELDDHTISTSLPRRTR